VEYAENGSLAALSGTPVATPTHTTTPDGGDPDAEHGDCGNVCPRVVNTHRRQGRTERVRW
jgi:hypothetical protein